VTALSLRRVSLRNPYLLTLGLLVVAMGLNLALQPNLLEPRVLNSNFRIFLPLMILTIGQTIVVIGGGIDLSVGAMVSLVTAILVTQMTPDAGAGLILQTVALACAVGMVAGALNGLCVAYLRLQPIVTTFATSFIFSGVALSILPRPGGTMPADLARFYRQTTPLGLPLGFYIAVGLVLLWVFLYSTRYGRYLFASGGRPEAAYASGVPVELMRFSTYVLSGLMAAVAALALSLGTGSGDARIGERMTLDSIVAVVLGGTRLSGGQGGIAGPMMGAALLGFIRNIISFANVPSWWQPLVDALIVVSALAGPGIVNLFRGRRLL
jgi:ribose transport system permease protein